MCVAARCFGSGVLYAGRRSRVFNRLDLWSGRVFVSERGIEFESFLALPTPWCNRCVCCFAVLCREGRGAAPRRMLRSDRRVRFDERGGVRCAERELSWIGHIVRRRFVRGVLPSDRRVHQRQFVLLFGERRGVSGKRHGLRRIGVLPDHRDQHVQPVAACCPPLFDARTCNRVHGRVYP